MTQELWTRVDKTIEASLALDDPAMLSALEASREAGLPAIQVSPAQGKLLMLLALAIGARRILEIGTLGGYSTLWLAKGLQNGGNVTTLEVSPQHASVARGTFERTGLGHVISVLEGPALETLPTLAGREPFDLVFIDADKPNSPAYLRAALDLTRPGALILVDNVVRGGSLADDKDQDPSTIGSRQVLEFIAGEPRLTGTCLQTVGCKGYDGFVLAYVGS